MNNNYTYIGCVLDRSGSMGQGGKIDEARNGFNVFLEDQKKIDGKADIQVTIFDNEIETIYNGNIDDADKLSREDFFPRGMTAYYDALGETITSIGKTLSDMDEENRPGKVIILVITDGLENSSKEYDAQLIKEMIETQRNTYNWEFMFMGADESAIKDAKSFGIMNTVLYSNDAVGTRSAYSTMSMATSSYRTTGSVQTEDEEE